MEHWGIKTGLGDHSYDTFPQYNNSIQGSFIRRPPNNGSILQVRIDKGKI